MPRGFPGQLRGQLRQRESGRRPASLILIPGILKEILNSGHQGTPFESRCTNCSRHQGASGDALLVGMGGKRALHDARLWIHPSRAECTCVHAGFARQGVAQGQPVALQSLVWSRFLNTCLHSVCVRVECKNKIALILLRR